MTGTDEDSHTPTQEPRSSFLSTSRASRVASASSQSPILYGRSDEELPVLLDDNSDHGLSKSNLSDLQPYSDDGQSLDEHQLRQHLQDVESSFIPDLGHTSEISEKHGVDDTYLELADPTTASKSRLSMASKGSSLSPTAAAAGRAQSRLASQHEVDEHGFSKPLIAIPANGDLSDAELENSLSGISIDQPNAGKRLSGWSASSGAQSVESDATIGAGKVSSKGKGTLNGSSRALKFLDRLPSLGSVASLDSSDEAALPVLDRTSTAHKMDRAVTPRASRSKLDAPTDTVLAARVKSIQVPDTIARDFMSRNPLASLEKRPVSSDGPVVSFAGDRHRRTLTLKEQNGKVDKLTKENFDLKLKIHFLDQALRSHSEEGVQELIDRNVQIQTDLANERKEMQTMKRKMRELERKNKEQTEVIASLQARASQGSRSENEEPTLQSEMHEEILHLRQQIDHAENQLTSLREEMVTEKYEKRKIVEHMRTMANPVQDSNGARGTIDMWEEMLNAETARREQAEEDMRRLKEELTNLRIERASPVANRFDRRRGSRPGRDDNVSDFASNSTVVDQLRQENAELRRDLGAQTSMLTSRNRERERLQSEIEDLKMLQRKSDGARSVAGDSVFDRSVSRAHNRAPSRASIGTALTEGQLDDWERKEGQWRDQNAEMKLKYQELERTHGQHLQYISALEGDFQEMEAELNEATEDLQALAAERDEALQSAEEIQAEYEKLEREALAEIEKLENELQTLETNKQKVQSKLEQTSDSYRGLQGELREITQSVMNLEDEKQASLRSIETLEQQLQEAEIELGRWEAKAKEYAEKNKKLEITGESLHSEVSFLREEQEGDKIKIGELEDALNAAEQTIADEQEKLRELEDAILDERQQRDVLENKSKEEVQKVLDDLNNENAKTKDEIRKLRRGLSAKEVEANSWRTKMEDLENAFREALGDVNGTKHSMLEEIDRVQRELESTANALDRAKMDHADKDRLLRHRDGLLESTSLEARRLSDLLDKERAARKHELDQFEKSTRGQATNLRQIAQYESRILELETGFSQDKRKMAALEMQFKEQLTDRNALLMALWNRLSTLCGGGWSQSHALINGEVPSADVISRNLPAFQRNIISAIKTIEGVLGSFKVRIRSFEKELVKDYQTLEHNLEMRVRRMDAVEAAVAETQARIEQDASRQAQDARPQIGRTLSKNNAKGIEELARVKSENKILRAELKYHRQHPSAMAQQLIHRDVQSSSEHVRRLSRDSSSMKPTSPARQFMSNMLSRSASSTTDAATEDRAVSSASNRQSIVLDPTQPEPNEQRWVHRLKEMERRLKEEREARLLDRQGARQRLEEGRLENEELKMLLDRERVLRESIAMMDAGRQSGEMDDHDADEQ